jgi:hypothetical protein
LHIQVTCNRCSNKKTNKQTNNMRMLKKIHFENPSL